MIGTWSIRLSYIAIFLSAVLSGESGILALWIFPLFFDLIKHWPHQKAKLPRQIIKVYFVNDENGETNEY